MTPRKQSMRVKPQVRNRDKVQLLDDLQMSIGEYYSRGALGIPNNFRVFTDIKI